MIASFIIHGCRMFAPFLFGLCRYNAPVIWKVLFKALARARTGAEKKHTPMVIQTLTYSIHPHVRPMGVRRTCRWVNKPGLARHSHAIERCLSRRCRAAWAMRCGCWRRSTATAGRSSTSARAGATPVRDPPAKSGVIFRAGIFLEFVRLTARTPHGAHVRLAVFRLTAREPHGARSQTKSNWPPLTWFLTAIFQVRTGLDYSRTSSNSSVRPAT